MVWYLAFLIPVIIFIQFKLFYMATLSGKKIAILTDHGFEEAELTSPKKALEDAGATVHIVSNQKGTVKAWNNENWSIELPVDVNLEDAATESYDALMIPGGVINPDRMRINIEYVQFAQDFFETGKPIGAICHGPQLLIETGMLRGKEMTSYPSIKTDLINAGANWQDKEVVVDNGLVTSRSPKDLEAFNKKLIEEIAEGIHAVTGAFYPSAVH
jgi:protease I